MKTIKCIAACLLVALSFNSCSSDDDEPQVNPNVKKRLTAVHYSGYDEGEKTTASFEFEYEKEKVVKVLEKYNRTGNNSFNSLGTSTLRYSGNNVSESWIVMDSEDNYKTEISYICNSDGYITKGDLGDRLWYFSYSNDLLTSAKQTELNGEIIDDDDHRFSYSKNGAMSSNHYFPTITYTDTPNVGDLFIGYSDFFANFSLDYFRLCYTGLLGKATKFLPKEAFTERGDKFSFNYEFDNDGYVVKEIVRTTYAGDYKVDWTATYTYETIK